MCGGEGGHLLRCSPRNITNEERKIIGIKINIAPFIINLSLHLIWIKSDKKKTQKTTTKKKKQTKKKRRFGIRRISFI